jgi:hypothetical protein
MYRPAYFASKAELAAVERREQRRLEHHRQLRDQLAELAASKRLSEYNNFVSNHPVDDRGEVATSSPRSRSGKSSHESTDIEDRLSMTAAQKSIILVNAPKSAIQQGLSSPRASRTKSSDKIAELTPSREQVLSLGERAIQRAFDSAGGSIVETSNPESGTHLLALPVLKKVHVRCLELNDGTHHQAMESTPYSDPPGPFKQIYRLYEEEDGSGSTAGGKSGGGADAGSTSPRSARSFNHLVSRERTAKERVEKALNFYSVFALKDLPYAPAFPRLVSRDQSPNSNSPSESIGPMWSLRQQDKTQLSIAEAVHGHSARQPQSARGPRQQPKEVTSSGKSNASTAGSGADEGKGQPSTARGEGPISTSPDRKRGLDPFLSYTGLAEHRGRGVVRGKESAPFRHVIPAAPNTAHPHPPGSGPIHHPAPPKAPFGSGWSDGSNAGNSQTEGQEMDDPSTSINNRTSGLAVSSHHQEGELHNASASGTGSMDHVRRPFMKVKLASGGFLSKPIYQIL